MKKRQAKKIVKRHRRGSSRLSWQKITRAFRRVGKQVPKTTAAVKEAVEEVKEAVEETKEAVEAARKAGDSPSLTEVVTAASEAQEAVAEVTEAVEKVKEAHKSVEHLASLTSKQLRALAKKKKIKGYSSMRKAQLVDVLSQK